MRTLITGGLGQRRSLESEAGKMKRLARQARKAGYGRAAQQAYLDYMKLKAGSPTVRRQEYRQAEDAMAASAEARQAQLEKAFLRLMGQYNQPAANTDIPEGYDPSIPTPLARPPYVPRYGDIEPEQPQAQSKFMPYFRKPRRVPQGTDPRQFIQLLGASGVQGATGL